MSKAKEMLLGLCHIQFIEKKQERRWIAHVAFHPMSKAKEAMGGSCSVPSNEQSNEDNGWLMSHSIQ
jgi:hypothetical protein